MNTRAADIVATYSKDLAEAISRTPYVVFLCGPALSDTTRPGSRLRRHLLEKLGEAGFDVVLGEDDGLENARINVGLNAQDNELEFIKGHCNSIVIVADSPGSFCELGLFSWHVSRPSHFLKPGRRSIDCVLIVNKEFEGAKSYFNEGPSASVAAAGVVYHVDFAEPNTDNILKRLNMRRSMYSVDERSKRRRR